MVNCSIVTYKHSFNDISLLIDCILKNSVNNIYIIDNSPTDELRNITDCSTKVKYYFCNKNLGYGRAHNIAIRKSIMNGIDYHVVINPDISFGNNLLDKLALIMDSNKNYGLVMPKITYEDGNLQYLCRLIPTPWDYVCKRYLPFKWAKKRADKFMLKFTKYDKIMNVPILSGCFMFFRIEALKDIGLFDERFFMYPEDDDITRRMHEKFKTIYYPFLCAYHGYEAAPYKSFKMHMVLVTNMIKYFNKWGWFFDKKRRLINKDTLKRLDFHK